MNARRINDWNLHHSLDRGQGTLVEEGSALYQLITSRLRREMNAWSIEVQPGPFSANLSGGHWSIDAEETFDWVPDGSANVVEMTAATEALADTIVEDVMTALRAQASKLLEEGGDNRDLNQYSRIALRIDFVDADMYGREEDDEWAAMPTEGALVATKATIHPTWAWRHP